MSAATVAQIARAASTAAANAARPKTGVLLMNLGGPAKLTDVQPFLTRLFSDPDLIPLPFQRHSAPIIAKRRTPQIQDQYAQIGGGSPILSWTQKQGALLEQKLDTISPETAPHKSYIGFRYTEPLTEDAVQQMLDEGIERAVAFTQYPQYSCSTTGSSLNELYRKLKVMDPQQTIQWSVIDRWPTHPGLVKAFAERIRDGLAQYPEAERSSVVVLFSAHSLPMTVVNRGDPYVQEVAATVQSVMDYLGQSHPYRLVWQSQVGPRAWMGPQTSDTLKALASKGVNNVLLVPIAFTSDHIETLFELDIEYGHQAKEMGMTGLRRAESLNDSPIFIDAMADIVKSHLASGQVVSKLMPLQCPMCTKDICRDSKDFFAQQKLN
ncbi:ferrochelatase hem15 [Sorochytrium milnesiophthora]